MTPFLVKDFPSRSIGLAALGAVLLMPFVGCQKQAAGPNIAASARPALFEHTVKYQGETLGIISKWYTGNAGNWKRIAAANPSLKPNRIQLGQIIYIPDELVTQRTPLPKAKVSGLASETKAVAKQIEQTAEKPRVKEAPASAVRSIDDELKELEAMDSGGKSGEKPPAPADTGSVASEPASSAEPSVDATPPAPVAPSGEVVTSPDSGATVDTPPPAAETPAVEPEKAPDAPVASPPPPSGDDAERERLLDELLQQQ